MSTAGTPPDNRDATEVSGTDRTGRPVAVDPAPLGRRDVVAREKDQFGGMKFGSAFFGWLAATGMAVLLSALVAGIATAAGLGSKVNVNAPTTGDVQTFSLVGGIVLLVIILIAYYCGGYVAGRMARFNGLRQGLAVWLWAIIVAVVVAILGALAGSKFGALSALNGLPSIPVSSGTLTTAGVVTAIAVAAVSLFAAILGGLAGMRFHRRVDRAGLGR